MQSRTPRLDWIGKVLADPQAAPERAEQVPLRLVAASAPLPGAKSVAAAASRNRPPVPARPRPKRGR